MNITINEIKSMLEAGTILPSNDDVVEAGELVCANGIQLAYTFHHGWDIAKAHACDTYWGAFNVELLAFIRDNFPEESARNVALETVQLEDAHWDWFKKSALLKSDEYKWFFIMADKQPQAACIIYHPKTSALEEGNIFYIEYIAVAPWNRPNPMRPRHINRVGTCIIRHTVNYAQRNLGLKPGFALHALPKAVGFYEKIGMMQYQELNKENLPYYEMPTQALVNFMEAS